MVDLLAARACCLLEWEKIVVRKARPTIDHDDRKLGVRSFTRSGFLIHPLTFTVSSTTARSHRESPRISSQVQRESEIATTKRIHKFMKFMFDDNNL